jgi:hypothetical protein
MIGRCDERRQIATPYLDLLSDFLLLDVRSALRSFQFSSAIAFGWFEDSRCRVFGKTVPVRTNSGASVIFAYSGFYIPLLLAIKIHSANHGTAAVHAKRFFLAFHAYVRRSLIFSIHETDDRKEAKSVPPY